MSSENEVDVFISYSRDNWGIAKRVADELKFYEFSVWLDSERIDPWAYEFTEETAKAIEKSKVVLCLATNNYYESYYCFQEFINARVNRDFDDSCVHFLICDKNFIHHPMVEASGNAGIELSDGWIKYVRKAVSTKKFHRDMSGDSFEERVRLFIRHLNSGRYSDGCRSFALINIRFFVELELADSAILSKSGTVKADDICSLSNEIGENPVAPIFYSVKVNSLLAQAYKNEGRFHEAVLIRKRISEFYSTKNVRDRIGNLDETAQCLILQGKIEEAFELSASNMRICEREIPAGSKLRNTCKNTHVGILFRIGRYDDACIILEDLYESLARHDSGNENSDYTLTIHLNYAFSLMRCGKAEAALPLCDEIFKKYWRLRGRKNIDTAQAEINYAECLLRCDQDSRALFHAKAALSVFVLLDVTDIRRALASTIGLQCADCCGDGDAKQEIFKEFVLPMLHESGPVADELRNFLERCPELVPAKFRFADIRNTWS